MIKNSGFHFCSSGFLASTMGQLIQQLFSSVIVLTILSIYSIANLQAGFVPHGSIEEFQNAPLLVVATVERIDQKEPVPAELMQSKLPERYQEATIRIHRSYPDQVQKSDSIVVVRYVFYGDLGGGISSGYPVWPQFEVGQTAVFPLMPGKDGKWRLVRDNGVGLTVPALVSSPVIPVIQNARSFILIELANALAEGKATDRNSAAVFLFRTSVSGWPDGFREVLESLVGTSDDRWLEVACALLSSMGLPGTPINELMGHPNPPAPVMNHIVWAFRKGATRDYPNRLIRCFLRNMSGYEWGSRNALVQFKDSPLAIDGMKDRLSGDPAGSIYVAWGLIQNGQQAIIPAALEAAVKLSRNPEEVSLTRLQASSALLLDYGDESQFEVILESLRRLKYKNEFAYRKLFGTVTFSKNLRELRVAAIVIDDCRPRLATVRYCDVAAHSIQRLSGESFNIKQDMTREERDLAVERASVWIKKYLKSIGK